MNGSAELTLLSPFCLVFYDTASVQTEKDHFGIRHIIACIRLNTRIRQDKVDCDCFLLSAVCMERCAFAFPLLRS